MTIQTGEVIDASDFINKSEANATPSDDNGRVPKLENVNGDDAKVARQFLPVKFGGDGSDGALSVSSGNTNIDLGGEAVVELNYSSISITGTGSVTFTNPHTNGTVIILRCQGDCTLTSSATPMLDASGCGADGGAGGVETTQASSSYGSDGSFGESPYLTVDKGDSNGSAGGTKPTEYKFSLDLVSYQIFKEIYRNASVGGGGGGGRAFKGAGATGTVTAGAGGKGGGGLILEVGGALNFTTGSISVAGDDGGTGNSSGSGSYLAGGGGGGGGGFFLCLYNELTANSGTLTKSGGTGANSVGNYSAINGGGGGASAINDGDNGTVAANGVKSGGDGGAGDSIFIQNRIFT